MSQDPQEPRGLDRYRARFAGLRGVLALEISVVAGLVVGVWWLLGSYEQGWPLARILLTPGLWLLVGVVSVLGALGNLALYYLGQRGSGAVFERFPGLEGERWERIGAYYFRYGPKLLIMSAIPGLGTVLTTGAGAFDVERYAFLFWVVVGKALRNWVIVLFAIVGFQGLFSG
jgi:membrane protein YqaA with SNARE-associated domain